jgi:hypothetical protein
MPHLPAVRSRPPRPTNWFRHPLQWLRWRWHQPDPHAESKTHRACRDFARHFRALKIQLPVFYLLGGIGAVAGGIVATSEHLDLLAIGEWSAVGLVGPPTIVCLAIFVVVRWKTPTKQRNEARKTLVEKDAQIGELLEQNEALAAERTEAMERAKDAEARVKPQIGQYVDKLFEVNLPDNPDAAAAAAKQLPLLGTRFKDETKLPELTPDANTPVPGADAQAGDSAADDEADGVVEP